MKQQPAETTFSHACDLDRMILAAASLRERLDSGVYRQDCQEDPDWPRWQLWLEKSSQGNTGKFARKLSWDGLDEVSARRVLSRDPIVLDPAPGWASMLRRLLHYLEISFVPSLD